MKRKTKHTEFDIVSFIGWIIFCEVVGILGSTATIPNIPTWYAGLVKPSFTPPNWIFGPVWITLYALMGIAAFRVSRVEKNKRKVKAALGLFIVQLFLNFLWSFVFFGWHAIPASFIIISLLWIFLLLLIVQFEKLDKPAGLLLIPYVLWVSFAAVLNYAIWILNP